MAVSDDFRAALAEHRPALLRHCYRMLGSWAEAEDLTHDALEKAWRARDDFRGDASLQRWLFTIATNACLNAKAKVERTLPRFAGEPGASDDPLEERSSWVTPAADAALFPDPAAAAESRETVALAFVAMLQRLPPKQRAALLLKDVLGWSAEEISQALELSVSSVNSALHRAREAVAPLSASEEPHPESLRAFVRAWEQHDLDGLVALLRSDVELEMPPFALWLRGVDDVRALFASQRFAAVWSAGLKALPTRANGWPALAFYRAGQPHALMALRFAGGEIAQLIVFIGAQHFAGFDVPRTV